MFLKLLKSKLHRAIITDAKLEYPGSIEIDAAIMEKAGILPYESVLVADLNNGNRLETYAVPGKAGGKQIIILGAAVKLINPKDRVIIMNFGYYTPDEAKTHKPKVLMFDEKNNIIG